MWMRKRRLPIDLVEKEAATRAKRRHTDGDETFSESASENSEDSEETLSESANETVDDSERTPSESVSKNVQDSEETPSEIASGDADLDISIAPVKVRAGIAIAKRLPGKVRAWMQMVTKRLSGKTRAGMQRIAKTMKRLPAGVQRIAKRLPVKMLLVIILLYSIRYTCAVSTLVTIIELVFYFSVYIICMQDSLQWTSH